MPTDCVQGNYFLSSKRCLIDLITPLQSSGCRNDCNNTFPYGLEYTDNRLAWWILLSLPTRAARWIKLVGYSTETFGKKFEHQSVQSHHTQKPRNPITLYRMLYQKFPSEPSFDSKLFGRVIQKKSHWLSNPSSPVKATNWLEVTTHTKFHGWCRLVQ